MSLNPNEIYARMHASERPNSPQADAGLDLFRPAGTAPPASFADIDAEAIYARMHHSEQALSERLSEETDTDEL